MIEPLDGAPVGVIAFKAVGKVEASDYKHVLAPAIEKSIEEQGKVRLVYQLGSEFEGYSAGAALEDAKLWAPHLTKWERCAVVSDSKLIRDGIRAFSILMPGDVKVFANEELAAALAWAAE